MSYAGKDFDGGVCTIIFSSKTLGSTRLALDSVSATDAAGKAMSVTTARASVRMAGDASTI